ncbi:MAG: SGNH/GDSL hydrolase family protein [Edaphobacter sp.]|uniref:SGNH/GDSL hydrolase family protein n=1 Tax=Edaphobacter sp. TaxID=1934404 RepID=UPI0023955309|nr:SGNH/GDSL hydrolase family protein [Edaphobacter sp.]MDE1177678.1 SGNH/GDSL hydrolase family protein [Edaphobacter sp.]
MRLSIAARVLLLLAGFALAPCIHAQAPKAQPIDRVYVFGDSYSDIGEGYLDSNGPTAVAYFADKLGTRLYPSNIADPAGKSLDFAISGAQTGNGAGRHIGKFLLGYGMQRQVDDFAAMVKAKKITFDPHRTLFYLAGGLNDHSLATQTTIDNLEGEIKTLYALGARRFEVAVLPTAISGFAEVAIRLNPSLERIPSEISPQLAGSEILVSHWGLYFDEVMQNPGRYGITNTTDRCAGREIRNEDTTPCANPGTYYFYHAEHPSTATHRAVGEMLFTEFTGKAPEHK